MSLLSSYHSISHSMCSIFVPTFAIPSLLLNRSIDNNLKNKNKINDPVLNLGFVLASVLEISN